MSDKLKSILPPKQKMAAMLSISFVSAFILFFYTPIDIYLHNPSDFVVGWRFLVPPLLLLVTVCFLSVSAFLLLIWHQKVIAGVIILTLCGVFVIVARFVLLLFSVSYLYMLAAIVALMVIWLLMIKLLKEKAFDIVVHLMWGLLAAAYIQTLFLNGNMIMIMGEQTGYNELSVANLVNLLIWGVITLLPLCVYMIFKIIKKAYRYEKVLVLSMLIIIGMQSAGLISTAVAADLPPGYDEGTHQFKSYEASSSLNKDENILVFILDRMDVEFMRETLETYPHLEEYLDGFTHYENNITEYWDTFPSVTSMLTHHYYVEGQTYDEYWEEAWAQHNFVDTLRANGFKTNLYLDFSSTYGNLDQIRDRTDNLITDDKVEVNVSGFAGTISRLSLGRLSPYLIKDIWLSQIAPNFGNNLFLLPPWVQQLVIGMHSDLKFLEYIEQADFNAGCEKSVFTIMHLNGAHVSGYRNDPASYGLHYDDESGEILFGGDVIDGTRVTIEILNIYFNKLREIGVYDNSTIIMLADHGYGRVPGETACLLIKPAGSNGLFQTDINAELSHKYFGASILDIAGLMYEPYGISYFDLINGGHAPVRVMFGLQHWFPAWLDFGSSASLTAYGTYQISGDANIPENWTFIPAD